VHAHRLPSWIALNSAWSLSPSLVSRGTLVAADAHGRSRLHGSAAVLSIV